MNSAEKAWERKRREQVQRIYGANLPGSTMDRRRRRRICNQMMSYRLNKELYLKNANLPDGEQIYQRVRQLRY